MAYDGLFIKSQINEIKNFVLNERINKITHNNTKEILFHIKKCGKNLILKFDASPNFPHIILCEKENGVNETPTAFCMLLRKYLQGGEILNIKQINSLNNNENNEKILERIINMQIENINENGDVCIYNIFFEIMGKYSNVIITNDEYIIFDTLIKSNIENVRLKNKNKYDITSICTKNEILLTSQESLKTIYKNYETKCKINNDSINLSNFFTDNFCGISKSFIKHIITKFNIKINNYLFNEDSCLQIYKNIQNEIDLIFNLKPMPTIHYIDNKCNDFYFTKLSQFDENVKCFNSINECLSNFILEKFQNNNDSTEKTNIKKTIISLLNKLNKKIDINKKEIEKCKNFELYKTYAELISAFGYNEMNIENDTLICENYLDNNNLIKIPLNIEMSISDNINFYYKKYNKQKRTIEISEKLLIETYEKIEHLNTIYNSLYFSNNKNDIFLIKEELATFFSESNKFNLLHNHSKKIDKRNKKNNSKINYNISRYITSNGIDVFVGKNNIQNEYLTFTLASPNDTWLHIKNATGAHVIIKKPYYDLDDKTLIEVASLAAYFSEKKNETKATVDYTLKKELKKVKGKPPGFCIYHKNYSINVKPEIIIKQLNH